MSRGSIPPECHGGSDAPRISHRGHIGQMMHKFCQPHSGWSGPRESQQPGQKKKTFEAYTNVSSRPELQWQKLCIILYITHSTRNLGHTAQSFFSAMSCPMIDFDPLPQTPPYMFCPPGFQGYRSKRLWNLCRCRFYPSSQRPRTCYRSIYHTIQDVSPRLSFPLALPCCRDIRLCF
jgi:hypothetical protein